MVIFNSFSNLINYITNTEAIKLIKHANAKGYFFLVCPKNKLELLEEYSLIAKKFEFLKEKIWFLFSYEEDSTLEDEEAKNASGENSKDHDIKLFFYDDYNTIGKSTYFFFDEDINYKYIHDFVNKKFAFDNLTKILDSKNKLLDIFEYDSDVFFTKYFVIFFYNLRNNEENKSMYKKWIYLLEKANFLINNEAHTKIQFFKYDFSNNKALINFPNDLNSDANSKIYLYKKKSNKNEISFEYKKYEKGPSLQFFETFLQENVPLIKIKFGAEENQKYFEEIFYNNELMELESEFDDIDDENDSDSDVFNNYENYGNVDVNRLELEKNKMNLNQNKTDEKEDL